MIQYAAKRNTLMVYLFVDSSGSMENDGRMKAANKVIDTTIRKLCAVTDGTNKMEPVFCAYSYAHVTKQIGAGPTAAQKFVWQEQTPGNVTCMGAALRELNQALDYCKGSIYQPVILFLGDGNSVDDIEPELVRLRRNPHFEKSCKFGISFDSDREEDLAAVVEKENLIPIQDIEGFYEKLESAVQTMIENQETGSAEHPNILSGKVTGGSEEIPFINHWSESDWL